MEAPFKAEGPGLDAVLGIEYVSLDPDGAIARIEVGPEHKQPYGIVHGGVYASIAESLTSVATAVAVGEAGRIAVGQSNSSTFLRPATGGTITATARALHRGRSTWVWDVDLTDDDGRVCALVRMTIAVREADAMKAQLPEPKIPDA